VFVCVFVVMGISSPAHARPPQKKAVLADALVLLRRSGQPPEESDDLMSTAGALGAGGVLHGSSMGAKWDPTHVTVSIYQALFPEAMDRAAKLFAGWTPPPKPVAAAAAPAASAFSMKSFTGEASGGGAAGGRGSSVADDAPTAMDMASFGLGGSGATPRRTGRGAAAESDDEAPTSPLASSPSTT
jgi:hypothetical protein